MRALLKKSPAEALQDLYRRIKPEWKWAFCSAFFLGLLVHMPILVSDVPNHDGLDSMYFDQNMITSGRWFLTVACGLTSYYSLPWLIGVLSMLWIGLTAALLVEFLEVRDKVFAALIGGLLAVFPAVASTFSYVFTMDGYMLALFLAVASVVCVKKWKWGFLGGAVCLAFSLGTYQAYLPFAVILCIYGVLMIAMEEGTFLEKLTRSAKYLYMGLLGSGLYYLLLQILLAIQGKELDTYQGINGMGQVSGGLLVTVRQMYSDFLAFTVKGNVLYNNIFSGAALCVLALAAAAALVHLIIMKKWWKSIWLYLLLLATAAGLPIASNLILVISPDVTYHLLMRYQWVVILICLLGFVARCGKINIGSWCAVLAALVLLCNYSVTDNIAYSNLQKRFDKTYAYCVRLLDRIEQTEGYYPGIPIGMVGVVSDTQYPTTDITQSVTDNMIGMGGDSLLYTGDNYRAFMKHYLGATLNILPAEAMKEPYYEEFYWDMPSFPKDGSIRIVDGVMYIKTENEH